MPLPSLPVPAPPPLLSVLQGRTKQGAFALLKGLPEGVDISDGRVWAHLARAIRAHRLFDPEAEGRAVLAAALDRLVAESRARFRRIRRVARADTYPEDLTDLVLAVLDAGAQPSPKQAQAGALHALQCGAAALFDRLWVLAGQPSQGLVADWLQTGGADAMPGAHQMAQWGYSQALASVLRCGLVAADAPDKAGRPPAFFAQHPEVVTVLSRAGWDPDQNDPTGRSALVHWADAVDRPALFRDLLKTCAFDPMTCRTVPQQREQARALLRERLGQAPLVDTLRWLKMSEWSWPEGAGHIDGVGLLEHVLLQAPHRRGLQADRSALEFLLARADPAEPLRDGSVSAGFALALSPHLQRRSKDWAGFQRLVYARSPESRLPVVEQWAALQRWAGSFLKQPSKSWDELHQRQTLLDTWWRTVSLSTNPRYAVSDAFLVFLATPDEFDPHHRCPMDRQWWGRSPASPWLTLDTVFRGRTLDDLTALPGQAVWWARCLREVLDEPGPFGLTPRAQYSSGLFEGLPYVSSLVLRDSLLPQWMHHHVHQGLVPDATLLPELTDSDMLETIRARYPEGHFSKHWERWAMAVQTPPAPTSPRRRL